MSPAKSAPNDFSCDLSRAGTGGRPVVARMVSCQPPGPDQRPVEVVDAIGVFLRSFSLMNIPTMSARVGAPTAMSPGCRPTPSYESRAEGTTPPRGW